MVTVTAPSRGWEGWNGEVRDHASVGIESSLGGSA